MTAFRIMHVLADLVCPTLGVTAFAAPLAMRVRYWWLDWLRTGAMVGWVVFLGFLERRFGTWGSLGLDYSTHTGVAIAFSVSIGARCPRLRLPVLLSTLAYLVLIVVLRFHTTLDVLTTAAVVCPAVLLPGSIVYDQPVRPDKPPTASRAARIGLDQRT